MKVALWGCSGGVDHHLGTECHGAIQAEGACRSLEMTEVLYSFDSLNLETQSVAHSHEGTKTVYVRGATTGNHQVRGRGNCNTSNLGMHLINLMTMIRK